LAVRERFKSDVPRPDLPLGVLGYRRKRRRQNPNDLPGVAAALAACEASLALIASTPTTIP
jgi:hypothetical protein